jgi:hypothetical protein
MRILIFLISLVLFFSCRSTKKIQKAIGKKTEEKEVVLLPTHADTVSMIKGILDSVENRQFSYTTFAARIKVEYKNENGKQPDFIANVRMRKDSLIWISIGSEIGIEGLRVLIDRDSIRVIDKLANTYQVRPLASIQDISHLPFMFGDLQKVLIGDPVFFNKDSVLSYSNNTLSHSILSCDIQFRHLLSVDKNYLLEKSKIDDVSPVFSRTASVSYNEYEERGGYYFSTLREIYIATQSNLDITLKFKDYKFNEDLSYPFTIPKKFKRIL